MLLLETHLRNANVISFRITSIWFYTRLITTRWLIIIRFDVYISLYVPSTATLKHRRSFPSLFSTDTSYFPALSAVTSSDIKQETPPPYVIAVFLFGINSRPLNRKYIRLNTRLTLHDCEQRIRATDSRSHIIKLIVFDRERCIGWDEVYGICEVKVDLNDFFLNSNNKIWKCIVQKLIWKIKILFIREINYILIDLFVKCFNNRR